MMSDDEEVVNKGNELYKHLLNLGYTEFETFDCKGNISGQKKSRSFVTPSGSNTHFNEPSSSSLNHINLSCEAHQTISNVINSKLLFVEDIEFLESLVFNSSIQNFWPMNNRILLGTLSLSFASWAIYSKIGAFIQLPFYLTGFCSLICFWYCQKVYMDKKERNLLNSHIESLKQLCICVQKTFRFLKETEILATGQVSTQNVTSAMYVKTTDNSKDPKELSSWKTLPQLRKSLFDALHQAITILLLSCKSFSQLLPFWVKIKQRYDQNNYFQEKSFDDSNISDTVSHISIKNLQSLVELYLDIQSEYLKILACCIFPQHLCQPYSMGLVQHLKLKYSSRVKADFLKILSTAQSKIIQVLVQLKLEQDIQNKFSRSMAGFDSLSTKSDYNRVNHFQVQLHSIFLLLELMLLRIRSLEDVVEDLNSKDDNLEKCVAFKESLTELLSSVRNDFQSTMTEFDHVYNHLIPIKPSETTVTSKINWEVQNSNKYEPISTGILLGISDFSINNSDEFFLTTAGSNIECGERITDDFRKEKKTEMPKTLISELSTALKSIRKDFRARERLALERIGLDGVEHLPSDDEDVYDKICLRKKDRSACNNGRDYTESAIHLGMKTLQENYENSLENKKSLELSKDLGATNNQRTVSVLDNSSTIPLTFTNTSLANLVATKSKIWGNQSEECFTDD